MGSFIVDDGLRPLSDYVIYACIYSRHVTWVIQLELNNNKLAIVESKGSVYNANPTPDIVCDTQ